MSPLTRQRPPQGVELEAACRPPAQSRFELSLVHVTRHTAVLVLHGELDSHVASCVRDCLAVACDADLRGIVVDLSEVSFIEAAGLGAIVMAARRLGPGAVALVVPHAGLVRIFRICGLDRVLEIYERRDEALEGLIVAAGARRSGRPARRRPEDVDPEDNPGVAERRATR